jgi:methyl-accepting chemotaxis protein
MHAPITKKRGRYFINKNLQIRYAILLMSLLILYTIILLTVIFLPSALIIASPSVPLTIKAEAANVVILLDRHIWPGIGAIIFLFGSLSIFFTHRLAGAVFAINKTIGQLAEGDLTARVRLRKNADLHEIEHAMNRMAEKLEISIRALNDRSMALTAHTREVSSGSASSSGTKIAAEVEAIGKILEQYKIDNSKQKG